ncbi:MAG: TIGR01777 family oxidoreductase [Gammaproteobacteria bacterium]
MNTHTLALQLMAAQGCLGAFDTLYHHELTEALAHRHSARRELAIHALRAMLYSVLFIGLSSWEFHGWWAAVLIAVFAIEIVLTLWDFVIEDRSRLLPATERVTHTILAVNGGAFIALLALNAPAWFAQPTALVYHANGALGIFLALCGIGVGLSGVRDALAALDLKRRAQAEAAVQPIHFADQPSSVLVTGATGFIGQRLVRALVADGHHVMVLSRQPRAAAWLFDGRVECVASMADLPRSRRIDVVINLAGARILGWRWSDKRKAVLRASRVGLTRGLVEWIARAEHKPAMLLSASAIGYYGTQVRGDETALAEDAPAQPVFMSQLCREWEAAAHQAETYGVKVACMRFGLVLGTQGALPMMLLPIRFGAGGPLGDGRQWLSWIHVDDLIGAIAHVWRRGEAGAYNFTAPECITQAQFARTAAGVLHRPCVLPTPGAPMRLLLGEQADLLLEGQRVVPTRLLSDGFRFRFPLLERALRNVA